MQNMTNQDGKTLCSFTIRLHNPDEEVRCLIGMNRTCKRLFGMMYTRSFGWGDSRQKNNGGVMYKVS